MTTFNETAVVNQNRPQTPRRVEWPIEIDFSKLNDGVGLAADESATVGKIPAGFVFERLDPVLRTPEGEAATLNVGTDTDTDGLGLNLNVNGAANSTVALAGTEAIKAGRYFHADTELAVAVPTGANTLNVAKVRLTLVGYMSETE
ncbi:MAG: hypothetical protein RPU39_13780 [Candidatus Sedimenticola sp. (ex Thyasira tokunagai)]